MSTAVSLTRVEHADFEIPKAISATALDKSRQKLIRVSPDYRNSTLWMNLTSEAPLYISHKVLRNYLAVCNAQKGLSSTPFRFRVYGSEHSNVFSLGGDLSYFHSLILSGDQASLRDYAYDAIRSIYENVSGSGYQDLCTVSVVQGEAQGGGFEAALSAHVLVAERGCRFGFPEGLFGMFPGMGGERLLVSRAGLAVAKEVIGSAKRWKAEELYEMGVVDVLADSGEGMDTAREFITTVSDERGLGFRTRFSGISFHDLLQDVDLWVQQGLELTKRNLRTMQLIVQAQKRLRNRSERPARVA